MNITPDDIVVWSYGPLRLNATIVGSWLVMALLVGSARLATRRLTADERPSPWQNLLEVVVGGILDQIRELAPKAPERYLPFVGTLFLFILVSNLLAPVPVFEPPTGSLSTTTALALCVLVAVPVYGIARRGLGAYARDYLKPTPLMLPLNIISELSRTLALAIRLYGNIMSGTVIGAILVSIAPFFFPVIMDLFGLLTGIVQAYIFAVLALVFIAAAARGDGTEDKQHGSSA